MRVRWNVLGGIALVGGLALIAPRSRAAVVVRGDEVSVPRAQAGSFVPRVDELAIFEEANAARAARGLPPLAWDPTLAAVARAHSEDMAARRRMSHADGDGAEPIERLRRSGRFPALLLENIGVAYSARQAHWALMRSPGHRANILSPEAERLGVGVAEVVLSDGTRQRWVTQDFTREQPPITDSTPAEARARIDELRREAGRRPLLENPALTRLAQEIAGAIAAGRIESDKASAMVRGRLHELPLHYDVRVVAIHTADVRRMGPIPAVADGAAASFGVGLARGAPAVTTDGATDVVLLLAHDR